MNVQLIESYEMEGYVNRTLSQKEKVKMLADHGYTDNDTVLESMESVNDLFDMLAFLNY